MESEFRYVSKFGTEIAKCYGEGSEKKACFSWHKGRKRKTAQTVKELWLYQNTTDSGAVVFLVRKAPVGTLSFLVFWELLFFLAKIFLFFLSVSSLVPIDIRGSVGMINPGFVMVSPCLLNFQSKNKERKDRVVS